VTGSKNLMTPCSRTVTSATWFVTSRVPSPLFLSTFRPAPPLVLFATFHFKLCRVLSSGWELTYISDEAWAAEIADRLAC
jgi:hypothetical protein